MKKALRSLNLRVQILEDHITALYRKGGISLLNISSTWEGGQWRCTEIVLPERAGQYYMYDADGKEFRKLESPKPAENAP